MIMLPPLAPRGSRPPHLPLENAPPLVELGPVDPAPGEACPENVERLTRRPGTSRVGHASVATVRSWLRPHRGISRERLPAYLGLFRLVHDALATQDVGN